MDANATILESINNMSVAHINPNEELDEALLQEYSNLFEGFVLQENYNELLDTFMHVDQLDCNSVTKCAILYVGSQFVDALVNADENNC